MAEKVKFGKWAVEFLSDQRASNFHLDRPLTMRILANLIGWVFIFIVLYLAGTYSYLLFHNFVELLAIIIASGIFIFTWNTRTYLENGYLRFIGISFACIAILDAFHMLAYKGMNIFPNQGTNLASQLWIGARYLQAFTFLLAPIFFTRRIRPTLIITGFAALMVLLLASIFLWQIFPTTYIEGVGLTPFKVNSEYLISIALLLATILLMLNAREFQPKVLTLLTASLLITIMSELAFTLYVNDYGFINFLGHYFKIGAYYLLYTAILVTGLVEPYNLIFRKLRENQKELWESMMQLQARNDELDAFAHTVAHDLKNPIAAISISLKTLEDPKMSFDNRLSFLADMRDTVDKMNSIIESLLLLSMVRKTNVPSDEIDMAEIISRVLLRLSNSIRESGAKLTVSPTWPRAMGYPPWIEEIWVNYITNAIQYGGSPPQIEIGATELAQPSRVCFWVKDHGPGISLEDQKSLFVEFSQLKRISEYGHGLGLSIAQRIANRLGGEVGVESQIGQGSKFFFTLPKSR